MDKFILVPPITLLHNKRKLGPKKTKGLLATKMKDFDVEFIETEENLD